MRAFFINYDRDANGNLIFCEKPEVKKWLVEHPEVAAMIQPASALDLTVVPENASNAREAEARAAVLTISAIMLLCCCC